ncbi:MAG: 30S ribosomal protein S9 [Candidatus Micrarchaeia archaeon]|jgi:small subunit ribosomal protein S9
MKKKKISLGVGKRKEAVARAVAKEGSGRIRINKIAIDAFTPEYLRDIILEPLRVSKNAQELAKGLDIEVKVEGSGPIAQAEACRMAIARALVGFRKGLEREFLKHDRYMLVRDYRKVETKKFKGPKARARFQKSYR